MKEKNSWIDFILIKIDDGSIKIMKGVFVLLFLIGLYITYDMWYMFNQSSKDTLSIYKPDDITAESLGNISDDCVAWLTIDDTTIDFPIMQGKDNVEYLNKGPDGNYSVAGSIFLDSRNKKDFSDPYNIVYGHHMVNRHMFGALDKFKDKQYFMSHRTGTLSTGKKEFQLKIIGYILTDAQYNEVFDTDIDDQSKRLPAIKKQAIWWDDDNTNTNILALTTCKEPLTTARNALICRMIETENRNLLKEKLEESITHD